jgi:hypothetical protein
LSWSLQLERLVSVQGRRADRQHAYRPTLVFDDLGDRHICHVHTLVEHTFGYDPKPERFPRSSVNRTTATLRS